MRGSTGAGRVRRDRAPRPLPPPRRTRRQRNVPGRCAEGSTCRTRCSSTSSKKSARPAPGTARA